MLIRDHDLVAQVMLKIDRSPTLRQLRCGGDHDAVIFCGCCVESSGAQSGRLAERGLWIEFNGKGLMLKKHMAIASAICLLWLFYLPVAATDQGDESAPPYPSPITVTLDLSVVSNESQVGLPPQADPPISDQPSGPIVKPSSDFTLPLESQPAQALSSSSEPAATEDRPQKSRFTFKPKAVYGVPAHHTRTITGTRSGDQSQQRLYVLLPPQIALTTQSQPALFWYLSRPLEGQIRLTINTPAAIEPLVELTMDGSNINGIQRLDLASMPVQLEPGIRYDFVVAMQTAPDKPTQRVYAKSSIWRVAPSAALAVKLAGADDKLVQAMIFAQEGIWIDALDQISQLIDKHPDYLPLRRQRGELLRQGGFVVTITSDDSDTVHEKLELMTP